MIRVSIADQGGVPAGGRGQEGAGPADASPLCRATLSALSPRIEVPAFDRDRARPGVVHLGVGGFHRAHMARYTHDFMRHGAGGSAWGIIGAGLRTADEPLLAALKAQDCLYTLVERDETQA